MKGPSLEVAKQSIYLASILTANFQAGGTQKLVLLPLVRRHRTWGTPDVCASLPGTYPPD